MSNQSEWATRVALWRESGKSAAEFCSDKDYSASTLYYRASRLKAQSESKVQEHRVPMARLVRKTTGAAATAASPIVVQIGCARVEVAASADQATLLVVLGALASTSGDQP